MPKFLVTFFLSTALSTVPVLAQPQLADVIPADAVAAVTIRSLDDVERNGQTFFKRLGVSSDSLARDKFVSSLATLVQRMEGVDRKRPLAVLLANPQNDEKGPLRSSGPIWEVLNSTVVALPYGQLDRIAADFRLAPGEVAVGKISSSKLLAAILGTPEHIKGNVPQENDTVPQGSPALMTRQTALLLASWQLARSMASAREMLATLPVYLLPTDEYVYCGLTESAVKSAARRKRLTSWLDAQCLDACAKANVVVYIRPAASGEALLTQPEIRSSLMSLLPEAARQVALHALAATEYMIAAVTLDRGIRVRLITAYDQDEKHIRQFFQSFKDVQAASLTGLPGGPPLMAHAVKLPASDTSHVKGIRTAVYRTKTEKPDDSDNEGLFNVLMVLESDDVEGLLGDISSEIANANRALGQLDSRDELHGLRLKYEPYRTFLVDPARPPLPGSWITIETSALGDQLRQQLRMVYGVRGHKIRLVAQGQHVVVLLGADTAGLRQTLRNLSSGNAGLATDPRVKSLNSRIHPQQKLELHVSLKNASLLAMNYVHRDVLPWQPSRPVETWTSIRVSVQAKHVELDLWVPATELNVMELIGIEEMAVKKLRNAKERDVAAHQLRRNLNDIARLYPDSAAAREALRILNNNEAPRIVAASLLRRARKALKELPDRESARVIRVSCNTILNEHANTPWATEAGKLLRELESRLKLKKALRTLDLKEAWELLREAMAFRETEAAAKARLVMADIREIVATNRLHAAGNSPEKLRALINDVELCATKPSAIARERYFAMAEKALARALQLPLAKRIAGLKSVIEKFPDTLAAAKARAQIRQEIRQRREKEADEILRQGENLLPRNRPAAKVRFRRVVKKYPETEAARKARSYLERIP